MRKNQLLIQAVAVSKPRAIGYKLKCIQWPSLISQNSYEKNSLIKKKTTASIGSGYEQVLGYQLWAHMLTIKLIDISIYTIEKKKFNNESTNPGTSNGCEQVEGHELWVTCSQSSSLIAQKTVEKENKNHCQYQQWLWASLGPGSVRAHMLTIKLINSLKSSWKKKLVRKFHCRYRQWLWKSLEPWAVSSHAHNQAHS